MKGEGFEMTLDEAIKHAEKVAEENRNVDEGKLDLLYCGDTKSQTASIAVLSNSIANIVNNINIINNHSTRVISNDKLPNIINTATIKCNIALLSYL